ncbi:kinase-like domain-containing protein [Radiomyces spectabilis]|uniref:kinase-like domain-containing protein n=1 Tax=Radiomyces spectabilis TaxID=64574 RepID=UPI00222083F8|nr:kinase-like domain-containing protein [Radiomyces spectabilis]KAI8376508.1 kinase-like domain-containing protein [Radiomyces spectabilis]
MTTLVPIHSRFFLHFHFRCDFAWWRQCLTAKHRYKLGQRRKSTSHWRMLSPNHPPLPGNYKMPKNGSARQRLDFVESQWFSSPWHRSSTRSHMPLYTIQEENEVASTKPSSSISRSNRSLEAASITSSSSHISCSSFGSSSTASYCPPPVLATTYAPKIPHIINDEEQCKRYFVRWIQALYRFQQTYQLAAPTIMKLSFDTHYNVQSIQINHQSKTFYGNLQYIPPESIMHQQYSAGLADVWVLGISLYRMLVGCYPFLGANDASLLQRMLHADFVLPECLSEASKDLLRCMLAPVSNRASLDKVASHIWLRPYNTQTAPPKFHSHLQSLSTATPHEIKKKKKPRKMKYVLLKTVDVICRGPYPPPRHPYRDLAHLGRR